MKKLLSIILMLSMLATSVVTASAATAIDGGESTAATGKDAGDYTIGVKGEFADDPYLASTLSFELSWDCAEFTYTAPSIGKWNAATHAYEGAVTGGWSESEKMTITVKNHSNANIAAAFAFGAGSVAGVKGKFTKNEVLLWSADDDAYRVAPGGIAAPDAPTASTEFTIDPASPAITGDVTGLGTITVRVKQATLVGNENELRAALQAVRTTGGKVYLANDITLTKKLAALDEATGLFDDVWGGTADSPVVLDLAGHTLAAGTNPILLGGGDSSTIGAYVTIQNGKITYTLPSSVSSNLDSSAVYAYNAALTLKNVSISTTDALALYVHSLANVVVQDTNLYGMLKADDAVFQGGGFKATKKNITVYVAGELMLATEGDTAYSGINGGISGHFLFSDAAKKITIGRCANYMLNVDYRPANVSGSAYDDSRFIYSDDIQCVDVDA